MVRSPAAFCLYGALDTDLCLRKKPYVVKVPH